MPMFGTPPPRGLNGEYSMGSKQLKLYRQQSSYRFDEWRPWLTMAWMVHFGVSTIVIAWACLYNLESRKYVPIQIISDNSNPHNHNNFSMPEHCYKGFVNVFATSADDPGAVVYCCPNNTYFPTDSPVGAGICQSPPWYLWLSQRLARFPEAWLLPLFPLLIRVVMVFLQRHKLTRRRTTKNDNGHGGVAGVVGQLPSKAQQRLTRRRFFLYLGLIQIRGWILYLLLDALEDHLWIPSSSLSSSSSTTTTTTTTTTTAAAAATMTAQCWYQSLLHKNHGPCHGRAPDFSDHMVLYFAQILPLALTEVLHSIAVPYWTSNNSGSGGNNNCCVATLLVSGLMYLYLVTFLGVFKTAAYFHTWPEVVCGYLVSLSIQIPLFLIQCTAHMERAREYFFGYATS